MPTRLKRKSHPFGIGSAYLFKQAQMIIGNEPLVAEFRFHPVRKWRFDGAYPTLKIAFEYQGGIFMRGKSGHSNAKGAMRDWEKFNEAQLDGWIVLQFGPIETQTGIAMQTIERAIKLRRGWST